MIETNGTCLSCWLSTSAAANDDRLCASVYVGAQYCQSALGRSVVALCARQIDGYRLADALTQTVAQRLGDVEVGLDSIRGTIRAINKISIHTTVNNLDLTPRNFLLVLRTDDNR